MTKKPLKEKERELLLRYQKGRKVERSEYKTLVSYSTMGVIRFAFSFTNDEVQAKLTRRGRGLLGLS
jgi:hypothetical protein